MIRVRTATFADASTLAAFAARTFTDTYAQGGTGAVARSRPEDVAAYATTHFTPTLQDAELREPALVTFIAEVDEAGERAWAGYAQLRLRPAGGAPCPDACAGTHPRELARFYVDPAWQGRGVADELMDAVLVRARAEPGGADPLWLAVYQDNVRAVAYYRRRGFVVAGEATFTMGAERQQDWLMVWRG